MKTTSETTNQINNFVYTVECMKKSCSHKTLHLIACAADPDINNTEFNTLIYNFCKYFYLNDISEYSSIVREQLTKL